MPPNTKNLQAFQDPVLDDGTLLNEGNNRIRCAILGCGMMGREHISYIMGYSQDLQIDFLCDPHQPSLDKAQKIMEEFQKQDPATSSPLLSQPNPTIFQNEDELLEFAHEIDLLVIASPNYLHTPSLVKWGIHDLTILVEKPVAVSQEQHDQLLELSKNNPLWKARMWVAMEYRFMPAIAKLISLLPEIGDLKMITIRENRFPFLHKIGEWNRDRTKTGDTLVEKCCHFFDLFRLITGKEANLPKIRALAQRGLNYHDEPESSKYNVPIIDAAYVTMPFEEREDEGNTHDNGIMNCTKTIGCLELCMYADGSRFQEEIIVTGTKGRLEAYLPENKVYQFERPSVKTWVDRSIPPPKESIRQTIHDCSDVKAVHGIENDIPTHGGYHYSSTAVEWYYLLAEMQKYKATSVFQPKVSLEDGMRAVQMGLQSTKAIVNI